jgi:arylformamidase
MKAEIDAYVAGSIRARALFAPFEVRYGEHASETIDIYRAPAAAGAVPLLVFIHGGYWQELSKLESAFMVDGLVQAGVTVAVVDYALAPSATIEDMVAQCERALRTLIDRHDEFGIDPQRVVVAGSSAGGHLASMATGAVAVSGVILLSGVFDLRPLVQTYINDPLGLDDERAAALSPLLVPTAKNTPHIVAVGEIETDEFLRQSSEMAAHIRRGGAPIAERIVPGRNHFDLPFDLARPSELHTLTLDLLRTGELR